MKLKSLSLVLALLAPVAFAAPVQAQTDNDLKTAVLGFYGSPKMIRAVAEYCFDNDGYQPLYMSAFEGWRIRNLPHLDLADAAAATLGGIDAAERRQVEALAVTTGLDSARANADVGAYCQNLAQLLEAGALDLDVYFPNEYARIRDAAGE